ncbi:MAG: C-terminal helicase domain-containing protein, partial [Nanoarchaeota archaeon]
LKQIYYDVQSKQKFSLLLHLLKHEKSNLVMVFCNTRRSVDFLGRMLADNGVEAFTIHGGLTQSRRNSILKDFHKEEILVLICTDVAARGLDIKNVSHIYNYDIPKTGKEYIHRIGRTARAGKEGIAINLLSDKDYDNFRKINRDSSLDIQERKLPQFQEIYIRPLHRPRKFDQHSKFSRNKFRRRENSEVAGSRFRRDSGFGRRGRFGRERRNSSSRRFGRRY